MEYFVAYFVNNWLLCIELVGCALYIVDSCHCKRLIVQDFLFVAFEHIRMVFHCFEPFLMSIFRTSSARIHSINIVDLDCKVFHNHFKTVSS